MQQHHDYNTNGLIFYRTFSLLQPGTTLFIILAALHLELYVITIKNFILPLKYLHSLYLNTLLNLLIFQATRVLLFWVYQPVYPLLVLHSSILGIDETFLPDWSFTSMLKQLINVTCLPRIYGFMATSLPLTFFQSSHISSTGCCTTGSTLEFLFNTFTFHGFCTLPSILVVFHSIFYFWTLAKVVALA